MKYVLTVFLIFLLKQSTAQIPKYIRTKGKLPQLAYSTGEDRLGSAKMGYIDTNLVFAVTDTAKNLYKIKLSSNHHAYIDTAFAEILPDLSYDDQGPPSDHEVPVFNKGPFLCESWSVKGSDTSNHDLVTFLLNGRPAYKSWMEINPARIKIELYNVQSNTNWITQLRSAKAVKNVWYEQTEDDVMLITIELNYQQHYGYSIGYIDRGLLLKIRRMPSKNIKDLTIVIDAGHGGTNLGATGVSSGILEKEYTLLFAKELQKILKKQKAKVIMIREGDTLINNVDRVISAIENKADLFISFHLNSGREAARGVSTYYKHIGFRKFTMDILDRLLTIKNLEEFGNIGSFNFQPIQPPDYISVLVEVAFLSNRQDEKMILDKKFRTNVANQVYLGIKDWLAETK